MITLSILISFNRWSRFGGDDAGAGSRAYHRARDGVDRIIGLEGVRAEIAMRQAPDGHGRVELTKFHTPPTDSS
jgi:hypothetical protein